MTIVLCEDTYCDFQKIIRENEGDRKEFGICGRNKIEVKMIEPEGNYEVNVCYSKWEINK